SSIKEAIILSDTAGRVLSASPAVERILGYEPHELEGRGISLLFTSEDISCLCPNILHLAVKHRRFDGELMLVRKDGSRFVCSMSVECHVDPKEGKQVLLFCVEDVEKRRELERTAAGSHYQDLIKIANGIAHEIRNPLVSLGGFLNRIYKTRSGDDELMKYHDISMRSLRRIENLIAKVELFARLPTPQLEETVIRDLIEELTKSYEDELRKRKIALHLTLDDAVLLVDRNLIAKALAIIVENAIQVLPGGGRIEILSRSMSDQYELSVADNGPGISADDLPYVFNPFFSTRPDGVGIDLAVVRRVAETHGGCVGVISSPGEGATFYLRLPVERRRSIRTMRLSEDGAGSNLHFSLSANLHQPGAHNEEPRSSGPRVFSQKSSFPAGTLEQFSDTSRSPLSDIIPRGHG
ncbi:MAG TPA: ATP-binding protein, partial [Syntrophobacter fumaroxidans]|nr:ATP-binding protein [Syntrophobacter fumaroxidans]